MIKTVGLHKKLSKLFDVPQEKCNGYYWLSDSQNPFIVDSKPSDLINYEKAAGPSNPFIIEAALYYPEQDISVMIKHGSCGYRIDMIQWKLGEVGEVTEQSFIVNPRLSGLGKIRLRTAWVNTPDVLCQNLNVLEPAWSGFVGFANFEKNEVE